MSGNFAAAVGQLLHLTIGLIEGRAAVLVSRSALRIVLLLLDHCRG